MLVVADRCDKCSAQAYVRFTNVENSCLDFCGHHAAKFTTALESQGFFISADTRESLVPGKVGVEVSS